MAPRHSSSNSFGSLRAAMSCHPKKPQDSGRTLWHLQSSALCLTPRMLSTALTSASPDESHLGTPACSKMRASQPTAPPKARNPGWKGVQEVHVQPSARGQ